CGDKCANERSPLGVLRLETGPAGRSYALSIGEGRAEQMAPDISVFGLCGPKKSRRKAGFLLEIRPLRAQFNLPHDHNFRRF
ncbi:MAG TPA: hypothetical protein VN042_09915, partial [Asticcacaulis sp.]|nr:hypothetical protein [Asticcacaulis sp.]